MMEHQKWFAHGYHVYDEIVRVPLMLRGPGVPAGRHDELVSGVDIAPSILAFVGCELPAGLDGINLLAPGAVGPERKVFVEAGSNTQQRRAVISGDVKWTLLVAPERRAISERRRFDLSSDPSELRATPWQMPNPVRRALLKLVETDPDAGGIPAEYAQGVRLDAPKVNPNVTPEQLEALKALGYAE
jgi:arylsulfatase A-like enzyme